MRRNERRHLRSVMVTGGAGFSGSHVVRRLVNGYPATRIICVDLLTYAGNPANLSDVSGKPNYKFIRADIRDREEMADIIRSEGVDGIVNLAAETHVDRSIDSPDEFVQTNVMGTLSLLNAALEVWGENGKDMMDKVFYQISTDEVFGALCPDDEPFNERTPYNPHSPYSASKASADHFVRAYRDTYGLPTIISNCSNNYGPNQFPEKLIPLVINNICEGRPIPVYGRGENVRDWLYVEDHASAIDLILHEATAGSTYCIGGNNERRNIDIVRSLIAETDRQTGRPAGSSERLITFVTDRKGHDLRYAIDAEAVRRDLGWEPATSFAEGLERTVAWYLSNREWLEGITNGAYRDYYEHMYGGK